MSTPTVSIYHGDALDALRLLAEGSVDAVITDPPYALEFMGRGWDKFTPGKFQHWCEQWATECLRVLKPGGHLLAFGGSRTWHRLAAGVEDAGFEMRDSIAWLYGQGFPKSMNVSKDVRFCQCVDSDHAAQTEHDLPGVLSGDVSEALRVGRQSGAVLLPSVSESGAPGHGTMPLEGAPRRVEPGMEGRGDAQTAEGQLHGRSVRPVPAAVASDGPRGRLHHGAPASHGAVDRPLPAPNGSGQPQGPRPVEQRSQQPGTVSVERGSQAGRGRPVCAGCGKPRVPAGLGTALKPAFEPIVVARKPLSGTVAQTVTAWGTGALNIDATRVGTAERPVMVRTATTVAASSMAGQSTGATSSGETTTLGRWPTNVVLTHAYDCGTVDQPGPCVEGCPVRELDAQSGISTSPTSTGRGASVNRTSMAGGTLGAQGQVRAPGDSGGASRFFPTFRYQAKAPTRERVKVDGVAHPTVKPLDLMRWLVRLTTASGGTVLDHCAGSGTTGEACVIEGMHSILIEREADYLPLIVERMRRQDVTPTVIAQGEDVA